MAASTTRKYSQYEKPASRVTMLDAVDLDQEIHRILKDQLLKIFHILSPSFGKWEPELDTLLRIVVWRLSLAQCEATFGQQLLSVKYGGEVTRRRVVAWAVLSVCSRYLHHRTPELTALLPGTSLRDKVRRLVGWVELAAQVATMVNWLVFLRQGRFPSLVDRLVGLTPVSATDTASRVVGYSFMTRELLWHGFIELIVFLLPLVNLKYLLRCARRWVGLPKPGHSQREPLVFTVATRCAVCHEPPVLPHHMGCPHSFCYYCLQSNRMADAKFECPTCGHSTEDSSAVQPVLKRFCIT